jgi:glycosyltransferase involved in cell wall biosynthesis
MKVLIVSKYFYPTRGGIETYVYELATELVKNNIKVKVLCADVKNKNETIKGIKLSRIKIDKTISRAPLTSKIFNTIMKEDFDICHLNCPNPLMNVFSYIALKIRKKPYIITYHSDVIHQENIGTSKLLFNTITMSYNMFLKKFLLKNAKKILATSNNYINNSKVLIKFKNKTKNIPCFIDIEKFKKKKVSKNKNQILFVGRLSIYKGIKYMIESMKYVTKHIPNAKLIIIGNGELKNYMKEKINKTKLNKNIIWKKEQSNKKLIENYRKSEILILPSTSKMEAFGLVQLEAMACETPVISTNIKGSGVPYANKNNVTGIIVPPKDSLSLGKAIVKLLKSKNKTKYGKNGRKRVEKLFSKKKNVKNIIKIYKSMVK